MPFKQSILSESLRQFDRLAFVARRPAQAGIGGEHVARRPSPSTDFVDYRPYHPGDDFRRVDWNVYGRLGSLQVKVTEGREQLDVVLVLDCSSSMAFGEPDKLEYAATLVAALGYVGAARADSVRIVCLGSDAWQTLGPFRRRTRVGQLVQQLSAVAPVGAMDLDAALAACVPTSRTSTPLVVIVSDLLTPSGAAAGLEALQRQMADVAVVHVVCPQEIDPRVAGELELVDAESGAVLELGVSLQTLAAYRARFAAWLDARAAECRGHGIRYTRVSTDRPLASVMMDDLRRAGLLK